MLREPTMEKLQAMRLGAMSTAWLEQQQNADVVALSFDERFAMVVDAEWMTRENKRLGRALKEAKLRLAEASMEGIDAAMQGVRSVWLTTVLNPVTYASTYTCSFG